MAINVEFLFDFGSPNAYLSHLVIPRIEARTGVKFEYVPVLLGGVFKATNNVSPAVSLQGIKNKPQYTQLETRRFLKQHGITDYAPNPFFPVNTLTIMRGAVFAQREGFFEQVRRRRVPAHVGATEEDGRSGRSHGRADGVGIRC